MPTLLETLKSTFGYSAFRPLQREIIEASLAGRDVFALLPTGGGKSLCFQLPALHRSGLTIVVSPLIALMKDQVDQLHASGVAATFINSSLGAAESRSRMAGLHRGEWKILYIAPERLMLDNWRQNLADWNISAIAIDEAHCISAWGHDFRPEYRQLARLRDVLPDVPITALTATATERVREDIVSQLHLRDPDTFVASFNRPNLLYRVTAKEQPLRQIVDFVKRRANESGIIYCATRATADGLAESLSTRGITAVAYHAGLSADQRAQNQDRFLRDEARVVCATIAFGMGINKPNVRYVVHHDLPKNIEGYYQETGRAGRDGLPSDCLLLFSPSDVAKQSHFIDEISNPSEQQHARKQLRDMIHYAECSGCRRRELLGYFGETFPDLTCEACDNCLEPRETFDGTIPAQKLLSCVCRVRQAGRFGVGMNHLVEILTGASTEKIRRWHHDTLSTYGIGTEFSRQEWSAFGRELIRLGLLTQSPGEFPTIEITETGLDALRSRRMIPLTKPITPEKSTRPSQRSGEIPCDEILFDRLRATRRRLAEERGVPAYVVFGDTTLREMARAYPTSPAALRSITGVGEKKLAEFGDAFLADIQSHLENYPKSHFS
jgi:ATP-dependent DNA helicase RecQ